MKKRHDPDARYEVLVTPPQVTNRPGATSQMETRAQIRWEYEREKNVQNSAAGSAARDPGPGRPKSLSQSHETAASSTTRSSSSTVANTPMGSVRSGDECVHSAPARTG